MISILEQARAADGIKNAIRYMRDQHKCQYGFEDNRCQGHDMPLAAPDMCERCTIIEGLHRAYYIIESIQTS